MKCYWPQFVALGLEISYRLACRVREKGYKVVIGDAQWLGLRDSCVDIVTMWDVVEHLARPAKVLKEIHRVLSPKGILILSTPNARSILHWLSLWMYQSGLALLQKPAQRVFAGHPLYFSLASLQHLLHRNGFIIRAVWQRGVSSEMSFRGKFIEKGAQMIDVSLGRVLKRRYRMVIIAEKGE